MLKYLEKLYFLNFCIPYTYFKFILAKLKQKNLYVRFTKKYQQTLVKPMFIKLGCQIVTRITIRNYQTSVSISIDIFIYTLQLCDNLLTPSLKLWDKTQYLARVWNLEKQDAVCFCLLWVYQSPSLDNLLWNHLWGDAQEISLCLETRVRLYAQSEAPDE